MLPGHRWNNGRWKQLGQVVLQEDEVGESTSDVIRLFGRGPRETRKIGLREKANVNTKTIWRRLIKFGLP